MSKKTLKFPESFEFAIADADLQVIGEKYCLEKESSEPTMWKHFAENSGKVHNNSTPDQGVNRYELWKEDIEILKKLGVKSYRTSVSMSRTLKQDGSVNKKAINWYRKYFKALNDEGINVFVTLYHWELPNYLHEEGGWKNRATTDVFEKHAEVVVKELGDLIEEYFILNEPWCSSILSYFLGVHAPGETDLTSGLKASHNLLLAQGKAFRKIKSLSSNAKVSTVVNLEKYYPASTSEKDILSAKYANSHFNDWFLMPMYLGKYPQLALDLYGDDIPECPEEDMEDIKIGSEMHALGINNYLGRFVKWDEKDRLHFKQVELEGGLHNDLGWVISVPPVYPNTLTDILHETYNTYRTLGLDRMYITENGTAEKSDWDGQSDVIDDPKRQFYYQEHIRQVYDAILKGVPVEKYFAWTLMDNYEWAEGYRPESCFGMIHVDRDSMKRVWKRSAIWYKDVIKNNEVTV